MTATRTSTGSAETGDGPADARPRIGLLGIMQELYDEMIPGITQHQESYARDVGGAPGRRGRLRRRDPVPQPRGRRANDATHSRTSRSTA